MRILVICAAICLGGCSESAPKSGDATALTGTAAASAEHSNRVVPRSGPFGLELGQPLDSLGEMKELKPGIFELASVPKPHPDIESVVVVGYPQTGICIIRGIGRTLENDGPGSLIRSKVDGLAEALATKYGKAEKSDFCVGGEVSCRDEFWMMTLKDNERVYAYQWKGGSQLAATKLDAILVSAQAQDISSSWPVLEYHGTNRKECEAAGKSASAESL